VLLYWLGLLQFDQLRSLYNAPGNTLVCLTLLFATIPISALRWHLLLTHQGFRLPFRKTLEVVFVGQFFNTFLPGAYGGDVVRVGYIYHSVRKHGGRLLLSILVDRLTGFVGLIGLGLAAQLMAPSVVNYRITIAMVGFLLLLGFGVAFIPALASMTRNVAQMFGTGLSERVMRLAEQVQIAVNIYLERWYVLVLAILISAIQFVFVLVALVVMSNAFEFVTVSPIAIVIAGIFSLVASSVPLTPGGIGVGEGAFANAISLIEPGAIGPYATIFLALRSLTLLVSLSGGLVLMFYRRQIVDYVAYGHAQR
jgi:uncharacterized protein (TIRG00374 family)